MKTRDILTEIEAIKAKVEVLNDSERHADLIISMLYQIVKDIEVTGANTTLRRERARNAMRFAAAHLGIDAA
jgi:hypothetical protein